MKQTKNVPQLRFSGFDDDWEEKKLGEIVTEVKRKADSNSTAPVMMISATQGFINQSEKYSADNAGSSLKNYTLLKKGELSYNHGYSKTRNFGSCFTLEIDEARIPFVYHSFSLDSDDSSFFGKYLNSGLFDKELKKRVASTARMDGLLNISFDEYVSLIIKKPTLAEQQKIGTFLSHVDSLIQAKTKKLESLNAVKKSLLQKCFPKAGEKVPEMRFETNQEWTSINFEDCFSFLSNNSFSRDELNYEKGYIKNLHYGDVLIKFDEVLNVSNASLPYITKINSPKKYSKAILKNGDIVIADAAEDNTVGKCTEIQNCTELLAAGLHTIAVRPKIEFASSFLGFCINSESFHNQLLPLIQGTKVSSISKSAILDTVIYYPKSITEQQKIGEFFSKYVSLISAQQKEIDKLKDIKKALLQKMFV